MMMSLMIDVEFRCHNSSCYPFARILVSRLLYCQTACLAEERCRTINFYQSTNLCELFAEEPDNNDAILGNTGTILMTIIDGTRVLFAQERCRTINFYQSTNLCELFAEEPDNNDAILANTGTILMTIIDGTRVPFGW
ncbi:unnamed protein product [Rotaria sp. Silwood2]|nr:unnamed protein product [Rotaria sp. Silwood2]